MAGHFLGGAIRPCGQNGVCHFRRAHAAAVLAVGELAGQLAHFKGIAAAAVGQIVHVAAEAIRIAQFEHALCAVDQEIRLILQHAVAVEREAAGNTALRFEYGADVALVIIFEFLAKIRRFLDRIYAHRLAVAHHGAHACHRPQQRNQRGQVVHAIVVADAAARHA